MIGHEQCEVRAHASAPGNDTDQPFGSRHFLSVNRADAHAAIRRPQKIVQKLRLVSRDDCNLFNTRFLHRGQNPGQKGNAGQLDQGLGTRICRLSKADATPGCDDNGLMNIHGAPFPGKSGLG